MTMQPRRILVVDDESTITSALSMLFKQVGYEVSVAHSGPEALGLLPTKPDLIILDIMLPGIDGYEVCRQMRRSPTYFPILMLTARDESSDKVLGLELGADAYLTKPFEPAELLAHVRALFRIVEQKTRGTEERPLVCGPLRLWEVRHRVEVEERVIELAPKEFELLRAFIRRPGHVLGRETLLREVWGYDYPGDSRTVDVHIQRLRAKIEIDPSQPELLHTVRGFGYRLVAPTE